MWVQSDELCNLQSCFIIVLSFKKYMEVNPAMMNEQKTVLIHLKADKDKKGPAKDHSSATSTCSYRTVFGF